jgi:putative peptidoglycan lipid II flippase
MLRGILTVGGWTMASRILGLIREMLIAALLGAGPIADAFFVALKLPNLFRRLFGEGAFNAAFIPSFSGILVTEGPEAARRFAEEAMSVLAFWLAGLTVVGEIFMPQLMVVLAPGFAADPAKFALTVMLSRITFPYLFLICLAALFAGVLNGLDKFGAATASYVLFNVVSIIFMLALTPYMPTAGHALSWGVTVSGVLQLALLIWAVQRAGMRLRLPRPRMTPQMRMLMRRMTPGLIGGGVTQINFAVDVIVMSFLPAGSVALLNYADRVNQLPLGVIGAAVSTALLPMLSRQVRAGQAAEAAETTNRALEYALFLTLPASLALLVVPGPIMSVLFGRGAFSAENVHLSSQSLACFAVGLPAFVMVKVLGPSFFARGDTATPVKVSLGVIVLNFALNLAFMHPLRHMGPALASSIAATANVFILGMVLARRGSLRLDQRLRSRLPRMVLAACAMSVALWATDRAIYEPVAGQHALRTLALAVMIAAGLAAYFAVGQLIGAFDARDLGRMLLRRRLRQVAEKES